MEPDDSLYNEESAEHEEVAVPIDSSPPEEEDEGLPEGPGFIALYTTLMLLLMTFFIVLVSTGSSNEEKFDAGMQSVTDNFNSIGLGEAKKALYFMYSLLRIKRATNESAGSGGPESSVSQSDEGEGNVSWQDGLSQMEAQSLDKFVSLGFNIDTTTIEDKYLTVKIPIDAAFRKGTAELKETFLNSLAGFLKKIGTEYGSLSIHVYSSGQPDERLGITSPLGLSALRAQTLAEAIHESQGIPLDKLEPIGYGPYYTEYSSDIKTQDNFIELKVWQLWGETVQEMNLGEEQQA